MNDTFSKSHSLPAGTDAVVNCMPPCSAQNPLQGAVAIEQAHHPSDAGIPLAIAGEQSIKTADELHKILADHLDRGLAVAVDLSSVDECDTAVLQLIYALRQSAVQRKQRFHLTAVSPAVIEIATALGLRLEDMTSACEPLVGNEARQMEASGSGI